MAATRRCLWTQRVKCPNREDMRYKESLRNWRKVYSMSREPPWRSGRPLYEMSLREHTQLLKISLDRPTTKGTSQRGMQSQKLKNSPDRTFQGETCRELEEVKTGIRIVLSGLCLLEVKTHAEECSESLNAITGARVPGAATTRVC